jgi:hypothetical protein
MPRRIIRGFPAQKIKFSQENDEIFMTPLVKLGISPIVEFYAQK